MQGDPIAVTARFSNGAGDPSQPDYAPDVRGLAVTFHLPDGSRTDISSQTLPRFPFKGPGPFVEFIRLSKPSVSSALKMPLFLARNPAAIGALRQNLALLKPPPSYAAIAYYALHAYKWVDAEGGERFVRYRWKPTVDLAPLGAGRGEAARARLPARGARGATRRRPRPLRARGPDRRAGRRPGRPLVGLARGPRPRRRRRPRGRPGPATRATSTSSTRPGSPTGSSYRTTPCCASGRAPTRSPTIAARRRSRPSGDSTARSGDRRALVSPSELGQTPADRGRQAS